MSKIYVVGIGPGNNENMTLRAINAINNSNVIIGYSKYIDLVEELCEGKEIISSQMRKEVERCEITVKKAEEGNTVSIISSGDSGIYGMAGLMLETISRMKSNVEIEIIPGITSACAAASILGAPIMHDFAVISLSDLMTPWEVIEKRLDLAAQGDFVICIYNPKSIKRQNYINIAEEVILKHRAKNTPVGIVRNVGRENECVNICTLENMSNHEIDMFSTVIIGNSQSYREMDKIITPRGYSH